MVAAMATLRGPVSALADISRLSGEDVGPWLREYEGYRGTLVFTDEETETSRLITLWETAEDEELTGNVLIGTSSPDGAVSVTQFVLAGSATVYLAGQTAAIAGIGALTIAANGDYTFTPAAIGQLSASSTKRQSAFTSRIS